LLSYVGFIKSLLSAYIDFECEVSDMGFVYVDVVIRGRKASKLVDTGFTYVALERDVIEELGLYETPYTVEITLADGRRINTKLYLAGVEVKGRGGQY